MIILSDNRQVIDALERINTNVLRNGGHIHPKMTVNQKHEQIWISCPDDSINTPLLVIPDPLFIPVTQLVWTADNEIMAFFDETASLTAIQHELLSDIVLIYNTTGKITCSNNSMPSRLLPFDVPLLSWLTNAWSAFTLTNPNPVWDFLNTRVSRKRRIDNTEYANKYLMPLIDLVNHHPNGAKLQFFEQNWHIEIKKPVDGSQECFLCYNTSDSLSLAYWHGYFEQNTAHLASLDCILWHQAIGDFHIIGNDTNNNKLNAPQIVPNSDMLILKGIVLNEAQLPSLRILLGLAVRSKRRDLVQAEAEFIADELIKQIIEANIQKYLVLHSLCNTDKDQYSLRPLFSDVAAHQLTILRSLS